MTEHDRQKLIEELEMLQAQFDEAGGRGVDLAERIDELNRELYGYAEGDMTEPAPIRTVHDLVALACNNVSKAQLTPLVLEVPSELLGYRPAHQVLQGGLEEICTYLVGIHGIPRLVERLKRLLTGPDGPRAYTREEMRHQFKEHALAVAYYWAELSHPFCEPGETEAQARCQGVVFSLLVMLDGGAAVGPFHLIPVASEENAEYLIKEGLSNYVPYEHGEDMTERLLDIDLAGGLHDTLTHTEKRRVEEVTELLKRAAQSDMFTAEEVLVLMRAAVDGEFGDHEEDLLREFPVKTPLNGTPDDVLALVVRLNRALADEPYRCTHGMFFSGAGACPQCGGG